jgi:hypothetical protein
MTVGYGLFILSTELEDEHLMRLRLERLLCWRESAERWSFYQHMLPLLPSRMGLREAIWGEFGWLPQNASS